MDKIGLRIKKFREQAGLNQKELGRRVGVSPQVISNWERGYTPTIDHENIVRLANALNVPVASLTGEAIPADQPDIRRISRAAEKMTPQQREDWLKVAKVLYPDAFKEK
jgi:transcriptional regulator with XRE-family HTH domain